MLQYTKDAILQTSIRYPLLTTFVAAVGAAVVVNRLWGFAKLAAELTVLPGTSLKKYGAGKGAWAAVTGPTGDIGREFAHQLASKGFNVLLVGRNAGKLAALAGELEEKYKVKVRQVIADLNDPKPETFEPLELAAKELEITVLVNSAGLSHDIPVYFAETDPAEMLSIIDINVKSTVLTTQAVLPAMLARKAPALVLTMGSFSALVPAAMLATYAGSKAFLERWSMALGEEMAEFGVDVRLVLPYFVVSSMAKIRKPSLMVPTPRALVKSTLSSLLRARGAGARPFTSTPYWSHALFDYALSWLGGGRLAMGVGLRMHKDIRRRALRKREREAKRQ